MSASIEADPTDEKMCHKKTNIHKYRWVKVIHHDGHNHPAKFGGPGVLSSKVGFIVVNRVSLIFKAHTGG